MAGPVYSAATVPVMENRPAPMMAPTPKAMSPQGPRTRFNVLLPDSFASTSRAAKVFLINNPIILDVNLIIGRKFTSRELLVQVY